MFDNPPEPPSFKEEESEISVDIQIANKKIKYMWKRFLIILLISLFFVTGSTLFFKFFEPALSSVSITAIAGFNIVSIIVGFVACYFCNFWRLELIQKKVFADCMEDVKEVLAGDIANHLESKFQSKLDELNND